MKIKRSLVIIAATLGVAEVTAAEWEVLGRQGRMQFALVERGHESDRQFFERAAKALCPASEVCQVSFWTDRRYVPVRTPLTEAQLKRMVAQYAHNPNTGFVQLLLPCRVDSNPDRCFE